MRSKGRNEVHTSRLFNSDTVIKSIADAFCILDDHWRFIYVNREASRLWRKPKKEVKNALLWDVFPFIKKTKVYTFLKDAAKTRESCTTEYYSEALKRWFQLHIYPFDGGLAIYFSDITKRKKAETELLVSENQFRTAMQNAPIGMAVLTPSGKYLKVNHAFCDIVGYSEDELMKLDFQSITASDDVESSKPLSEQLLSGEISSFQMEKKYIHKYDYFVWVQLNISLVRDDLKKPLYLIAQVQDITSRRNYEEQLRKSEERYRLIQRAADNVIWDWDLVADRMYVSDNFRKIFHYDPLYIEQQPFKEWWLKRLHPDDKSRVLRVWEQVIEKDKNDHFTIEYRLLGGNGQYVHLLSQGLVLYEKEKATRLIGTKTDITARKAAELALRQSEERYGLVVNNVSDLISIIDPETNYILCSPSHKVVMGYEPEELIGVNALSLVHPDDLPKVIDGYHKVLLGESGAAVFRVRHKDGHYVTIEGSGKAILDAYGKPYVLVITSHDITERIELEKRKDRFISMASHELRTPLTTLKAYIQILEKKLKKDGKSSKYLEKTQRELERLIALAKDLLDVSQLEEERLELHPEQFRVDTLVKEVASDMQSVDDSYSIITRARTPIKITADKYRINQVLTNLLSNAIKFSSSPGKIIVSVTQEASLVTIKVQDFGVGIPKDEQQKIFEAFYQGHNLMLQSRMGLGLGLHIVAKLVKEHHGTVEVISEVGKGSTFIVHIPTMAIYKDLKSSRSQLVI